MTLPSMQQALQEVLRGAKVPHVKAFDVTFLGRDPVYPTRFKVATAGSAALGAMAIAMADIREAQRRVRPSIEIDVCGATASLRSSRYTRVDGQAPAERSGVTGFYRARDARWTYVHCNHAPHLQALLAVLGVPEDKSRVAHAISAWNAFALEAAVENAGGLAPAVRTLEEWRALPNTPALATERLLAIEKVGDSERIALPAGLKQPLAGLKVLDLTRVLAGPTCGRVLAEAGADVLKITCERHPDLEGYQWDTGYAKRRSIIDLATDAGSGRLTKLLEKCDVFCQAYRPGALAGLGFGLPQVQRVRPGIVYASLSAFGFSGTWRARRGFDTVVQATSGMALISGGAGGMPRFTPVSALDYVAGYLLAAGVLFALKRRHDEGGSYAVNVSLARCAEWLMSLGLHDDDDLGAARDELADISRWLVDVPTPLGSLTRLRPVVRYSEPAMNELISWADAGDGAAAWR